MERRGVYETAYGMRTAFGDNLLTQYSQNEELAKEKPEKVSKVLSIFRKCRGVMI